MRRLAAIALIVCLPVLAADAPAPKPEAEPEWVVMPAAHYERLTRTLKAAIDYIESQRREIEWLKSEKCKCV